MNGNAELLNFIYQNSQMGVNTLNQLIDITKNDAFKKQLVSQLNEYELIHAEAKKALNSNGYDEKGIGALSKFKTYIAIDMQTIKDDSVSHIAEMLIIGSTMGVVDAIKNRRKYKDAEDHIVSLMGRLLKFEEENINKLKFYLG